MISEKDKPKCKGCSFWRSLGGGADWWHGCHHLLDTGKRRVEIDGVCLSKEIKGGRGDVKDNP